MLTIPPPAGLSFRVWATSVIGTACLMLLIAIWPAGETLVGGLTVSGPRGMEERRTALLIAVVLLGIACHGLRQHRTGVTIVVRGRQLTCSVPGIRGIVTRTYDLTNVGGAMFAPNEDGGGALVLLAKAGRGYQSLFNGFLYRSADLEFAAAALRAAVAAPGGHAGPPGAAGSSGRTACPNGPGSSA